MKKGDDNRGDNLLKKLIDAEEFQKGIHKIRNKFAIPEKGCSCKKNSAKLV